MGSVTRRSVRKAAELFHGAGLGLLPWETALEGLAEATGSTGAQLIGLGDQASVPINLMTGVPPETAAAFVEAGGGDPAINSRVRIGTRAAELEVLDETAFTTAADMRLNPDYADWIRTFDMHHTCLTNLVKSPDRHSGLALLRRARDGNVDDAQKRVFAALAVHARSAVRTQMSIEARGVELMSGALEAVRVAAFFCCARGRVIGMTPSAEALLSLGDVVRLRRGELTTVREADQASLEAALELALRGYPSTSPVMARRRDGRDWVVIEVSPLPSAYTPRLGPQALIVVHARSADETRLATAAAAAFGLTPSEAAIAAQLAAGRSPATIAHERRVSMGTVRTQIRRIYEKAGVGSQLELVARLPRF